MFKYFLLCILLFSAPVIAAEPERVDKKIILAIDVSGSITEGFYSWQIEGYADALASPEVAQAISEGHFGKVAFAIIQFSSNTFLIQDWKIVDSNNVKELSNIVRNMERRERRMTGIGRALLHAKELIVDSNIEALQTVIIMNGQDDQNIGLHPWPLSQEISEYLKVTIVGTIIPFRLQTKDPELFYNSYITFGPGNFVKIANDSNDFKEAMLRVFRLNEENQ